MRENRQKDVPLNPSLLTSRPARFVPRVRFCIRTRYGPTAVTDCTLLVGTPRVRAKLGMDALRKRCGSEEGGGETGLEGRGLLTASAAAAAAVSPFACAFRHRS